VSESSELTGPIIKALRQMGYLVFRMNSGKVRVRGGWMQLCDEGTADILAFGPALWGKDRTWWIETKQPKGKTLKSRQEAQEAFCIKVSNLGHQYIRATSLDEVLEALK